MRALWLENFGRWFSKENAVSARYLRGIASYGKKVNSEERKQRILAELNAMGVKPRIRRKMRRTMVGYDASGMYIGTADNYRRMSFTIRRGIVYPRYI